MKGKKIIAVIVGLCVAIGAAAGGIHGYKSYQKKSLVAEVQPVSNINWGYYGDAETSYGMVTNDSSQEVYLTDSKTVKKVYVEEGDTVKTGDPLLEYDTAELKIEIERKKLDIGTIENNIAIASHTLEAMRQAKPVDKTPPKLDTKKIEEFEKQDKEKNSVPEKDKVDSRIYNYVTEASLPYNMKTDPATGELVYPAGTEEDPYIYYCNPKAYVYGSFFNSIRPASDGTPGKYVKFIVCRKDAAGMMVFSGDGTGGTGDTGENGENSGTGGNGTTGDGSGESSGNGTTGEGTGGTTGDGNGGATGGNGTSGGTTDGSGTTGGTTGGSGTTGGTGGTTDGSGTTDGTTGGSAGPAVTGRTASTAQTDAGNENGGNTGADGIAGMGQSTGNQTPETGNRNPETDTSVSPNTAVFNGNNIPADYDTSRMWYIFTGEEYIPVSAADKYMDDFLEHATDWKMPEGYTEEELVKGIAEKESELKSLDIKKRQQELSLQSMQQTASDGIVRATVDGVVKTVGDPDEFQSDGTAFLVVTGDDGLYVSGTISELLLNDIEIGTVVTANSWESGMTFEATITEVSDYPVSNNSWGDGNPNVSYYSYTAFIEDSSALRNGEYVDLSIATNQSEAGGLFIEKAYVRTEDGKSYCMIADENECLKKQYVVTGRTVFGSAVEIKSGLTEEDRIAFPYGKEAVEGAAVKEASNMYN